MELYSLLLVTPDHLLVPDVRAAMMSWNAARLVGDIGHGAEAVREAARLRPAAILVAADLPGRLLVPLVRDLRGASDGSAMVIIGARPALNGVTLRALLDTGVAGCLTWEDAAPNVLPHYLMTALAGGVVVSRGLLSALLGAYERRRGSRLEGLALTPQERAMARVSLDEDGPNRAHVALWVHDPAIAASIRLHVAQANLTLEVADTAAVLLDAAPRSVALVLDCVAVPDALDRCLAIVPRVTRPVLICHPDRGFVDDLRPHATAELVWLPPPWLGMRLRDKLRLLSVPVNDLAAGDGRATLRGALGVGVDAIPLEPLTEREREVLGLVEAGQTTREIAVRLGLSRSTVKTHKANALRKLGLGNGAGLGSVGQEDEGTSPKRRET